MLRGFEFLADIEFLIAKHHLTQSLEARSPEAVHVCTLLLKPKKLKVELDIKYVALEIPNDFIVGFGLDYDEYGRNLKDIYVLDK